MELMYIDNVVNGNKTRVPALCLEEDVYVLCGMFGDSIGFDLREGKSLRNFTKCDIKLLANAIGVDALKQDRDLQQFLFDMFLGNILYLTKTCPTVDRLLNQRTVSYFDDTTLVNFFKKSCEYQGLTSIEFNNIAVSNYVDRISFNTNTPIFKSSRSLRLNILTIRKYVRSNSRNERDWIERDNVFNTQAPWSGIRVIPQAIEGSLSDNAIGAVYFTDQVISAQGCLDSVPWYATYTLPTDKVQELIPEFYTSILDSLLPLVNTICFGDFIDIDTYTVTEKVFSKFVESLRGPI